MMLYIFFSDFILRLTFEIEQSLVSLELLSHFFFIFYHSQNPFWLKGLDENSRVSLFFIVLRIVSVIATCGNIKYAIYERLEGLLPTIIYLLIAKYFFIFDINRKNYLFIHTLCRGNYIDSEVVNRISFILSNNPTETEKRVIFEYVQSIKKDNKTLLLLNKIQFPPS